MTNTTSDPVVLEELQITQTTLDGIANLALGAADVDVPADCDSSPSIGCVAGVPTSPAGTVHVTASSIVTTPAGQDAWNATAHVGGTTVAPIPFTYSGVNCTVAADTSLGANPDVTVTAQLLVKSFPNPNGPKNYVQVANPIVSGMDTADLTIGGGGLCSLASFFLSTIDGHVEAALAAELSQNICGDPNTDGYIVCPPLQ